MSSIIKWKSLEPFNELLRAWITRRLSLSNMTLGRPNSIINWTPASIAFVSSILVSHATCCWTTSHPISTPLLSRRPLPAPCPFYHLSSINIHLPPSHLRWTPRIGVLGNNTKPHCLLFRTCLPHLFNHLCRISRSVVGWDKFLCHRGLASSIPYCPSNSEKQFNILSSKRFEAIIPPINNISTPRPTRGLKIDLTSFPYTLRLSTHMNRLQADKYNI